MKQFKITLLLTLGLFLTACATQDTSKEVDADQFVRVEGRQFILNDTPYYFVGTNFWYGAYLGSSGETGDRDRLIKELDLLKANGITNLRVLAASEDSELMRAVRPAIVEAPGQYNEDLLVGLDFLLKEMAKRDMKAVLYLNNFWQWSGGMSQYVSWFTGEEVVDPDVTNEWNAFMENSARFYRMPEAQEAYRDVIKTIIQRKNTLTGTYYYDDPTVMSWQLANEPRPGSDEYGQPFFEHFKDWVHDTSKYIKSLAPNQLVSTGNEGAMGALRDDDLYIISHMSPYVDYLTFHMWLKNWGWFDITRPDETYDSAMASATAYINRHVDIANKMNMPTVLSEFGAERDQGAFEPGTSTVYRDRIYREVFDQIHKRAAAGDAISGTNFWTWGGYGRATQKDFMWTENDDFTGDPPQEHQGLNSVFDTDHTTIEIIREHADKMHKLKK